MLLPGGGESCSACSLRSRPSALAASNSRRAGDAGEPRMLDAELTFLPRPLSLQMSFKVLSNRNLWIIHIPSMKPEENLYRTFKVSGLPQGNHRLQSSAPPGVALLSLVKTVGYICFSIQGFLAPSGLHWIYGSLE